MNPIAERLIAAEMKLAGVLTEHQDLVSVVLSRNLRLGDDGDVDVIDDAGNIRIGAGTANMTVAELVAEAKRKSPVFFNRPESPSQPETAKPMSMTDAMVAELRSRRSAENRSEQAAEIAALGSPWAKSSWNMTRQMQITRLDPVLAARLKQEARS